MKLAIAQIDVVVGDLTGNVDRIVDAARKAREVGASLLLTPELALSGYPPEDLLLREGFNLACLRALAELAQRTKGITVVVGHPDYRDGERFNAASVLADGKVIATYHKHILPNHTVFDEVRYFTPGSEPCVFEHEGRKLGLNICADIWEEDPPRRARAAGAEALLVLNASPYHMHKQESRVNICRVRAREHGIPVVYANLVGGQDELVFDGASIAVDAGGELKTQLPFCEEAVGMVVWDEDGLSPGKIEPEPVIEEAVYRVLCLGVKDYVDKNGFPGVEIGLSGGIDSALTLAIAVDALGPERVHAVMMPSQFTASMSLEDARTMAQTLGVRYSEIPIKPIYDAFLAALADEFDDLPFDTTEENIQARVRGTLLMALSNKYRTLVLTTGNKSELAVGYATLYGDMAGGFGVLKDIPKTLVYRLARWRNARSPVIPERVIKRPPSAELKPNQVDQDMLPPYEVLDPIMEAYVERDLCPEEIVALGFEREDVARVVSLVDRNEYKRRQAPVGVRVTPRAFGKDRRYPITNRYRPRI